MSQEFYDYDPGAELIKLPPLDIEIIYAPHATSEHMSDISGADIFIPELAGWEPGMDTVLASVARGDVLPHEALPTLSAGADEDDMHGYKQALLHAIAGTNVAVGFADVPAGHQYDLLYHHLQEEGIVAGADFDETIQNVYKYIDSWATLISGRDKHIATSLNATVKNAIKYRFDLQQKDRLKVVMTLGSLHAGVTERLRSTDTGGVNTVTTHGNTNPETAYDYFGEAVDKQKRGEAVDDQLAARVLLEHVIQKNQTGYQIQEAVNDGYLMLLVAKKIASHFNKDEIATLYKQSFGNFALMDGLLREDMEENSDNGLLAQKGIVLPHSKDEATKFIQ
ncbi:MAG: hypothetical protein M3Q44_03950 [bacterium]|nr:hypothetical protein [bacterium]